MPGPLGKVSDKSRFVANVAALANVTGIRNGDRVETQYCREEASAGGAPYIYHSTGRSGVTTTTYGALIDGPGADDYFAIADTELARDVRVWGCLVDDTDCTTELAACHAYWLGVGKRQWIRFVGDFTFDPSSVGLPTSGSDAITWMLQGEITPTATIPVSRWLSIVGEGGNDSESTQFGRALTAKINGITSETPTILVKGSSGPKLIKNIEVQGAWRAIQVGDGEEANSEAICTLENVDITVGNISGAVGLYVDSWFWLWCKDCTWITPPVASTAATANVYITSSNENVAAYTGHIRIERCVGSGKPVFIVGGGSTARDVTFIRYDHESLQDGEDCINIDATNFDCPKLIFDNLGIFDSALGADSYHFNITGDNEVFFEFLSTQAFQPTFRNNRFPDFGKVVSAAKFRYGNLDKFVASEQFGVIAEHDGLLKARLLSRGMSHTLPMGVADDFTVTQPPSSVTDYTVTDVDYWDGTQNAKQYVRSTGTSGTIISNTNTSTKSFQDGDFYIAVTFGKNLGATDTKPPIRLSLRTSSLDFTKLTGDVDSSSSDCNDYQLDTRGWFVRFSAIRIDETGSGQVTLGRRFDKSSAAGGIMGPTIHGKLAAADGWTRDDVMRLMEAGWLTDAKPGTASLMAHQALRTGRAATASLPDASDRGQAAIMYDTDNDNLVTSDGTNWKNVLSLQSAASHIADASTSHDVNATFSDTEVEAALDALGGKINSILAAIEAAGITETS